MNITDQAKVLITEALTSNQGDYLRVIQQAGCFPCSFGYFNLTCSWIVGLHMLR